MERMVHPARGSTKDPPRGRAPNRRGRHYFDPRRLRGSPWITVGPDPERRDSARSLERRPRASSIRSRSRLLTPWRASHIFPETCWCGTGEKRIEHTSHWSDPLRWRRRRASTTKPRSSTLRSRAVMEGPLLCSKLWAQQRRQRVQRVRLVRCARYAQSTRAEGQRSMTAVTAAREPIVAT